MMSSPLIAICIPTYERVEYLERLLNSIREQSFRDFEVIITDDSKTEQVKTFVNRYAANFPLHYYKNTPALGTAGNMNEGMKYANAPWIKVIHDDDFLTDAESLAGFAAYAKDEYRIVYGGFTAYYEETNTKTDSVLSLSAFKKISEEPALLLTANSLGVPSVVMFRRDETLLYDTRFNWLTDIDCYIRWFDAYKGQNAYIPQSLLTISYNTSQLTAKFYKNRAVVIPDFLLFNEKHPGKGLKNIKVYDAWWRMVRNLAIRSSEELAGYSTIAPPQFLKKIINAQKMVPKALLKTGIISKCTMALSYISNRRHFPVS